MISNLVLFLLWFPAAFLSIYFEKRIGFAQEARVGTSRTLFGNYPVSLKNNLSFGEFAILILFFAVTLGKILEVNESFWVCVFGILILKATDRSRAADASEKIKAANDLVSSLVVATISFFCFQVMESSHFIYNPIVGISGLLFLQCGAILVGVFPYGSHKSQNSLKAFSFFGWSLITSLYFFSTGGWGDVFSIPIAMIFYIAQGFLGEYMARLGFEDQLKVIKKYLFPLATLLWALSTTAHFLAPLFEPGGLQ